MHPSKQTDNHLAMNALHLEFEIDFSTSILSIIVSSGKNFFEITQVLDFDARPLNVPARDKELGILRGRGV